MIYLDHLVINAANVEKTSHFYRDLLNCSIERWDEFCQGQVKFPSLRISDTFIIDIFPPKMWGSDKDADKAPNINHFCLATTQQHWQKVTEYVARKGITIEKGPEEFWGARGNGMSIFVKDPDGNTVEIRKYCHSD